MIPWVLYNGDFLSFCLQLFTGISCEESLFLVNLGWNSFPLRKKKETDWMLISLWKRFFKVKNWYIIISDGIE